MRLRYTLPALADLTSILDYIADRSPQGAARRGIALMDDGRRRDVLATWLTDDLPARFAQRILPIDHAVAEQWGDLMAQSRRRGIALSVMDGFFAATALAKDLTLVTHNVRDFAAFGVPHLNPWDE